MGEYQKIKHTYNRSLKKKSMKKRYKNIWKKNDQTFLNFGEKHKFTDLITGKINTKKHHSQIVTEY